MIDTQTMTGYAHRDRVRGGQENSVAPSGCASEVRAFDATPLCVRGAAHGNTAGGVSGFTNISVSPWGVVRCPQTSPAHGGRGPVHPITTMGRAARIFRKFLQGAHERHRLSPSVRSNHGDQCLALYPGLADGGSLGFPPPERAVTSARVTRTVGPDFLGCATLAQITHHLISIFADRLHHFCSRFPRFACDNSDGASRDGGQIGLLKIW